MPQKKFNIIWVIIWIVPVLNLNGGNLDFSNYASNEINTALNPTLTFIAFHHQSPLGLSAYSTDPALILSARAASVQLETGFGYPVLWAGFTVTPNLKMAANLSSTYWQDDNLQSIGPVLASSWGDRHKSTAVCIAQNHLKGPDDFHLKDIHLTLARIYRSPVWTYACGISTHFLRTSIHITDNDDPAANFKKTANFTIHFLRGGLYWQPGKYIQLGSELGVTREHVNASIVLNLLL